MPCKSRLPLVNTECICEEEKLGYDVVVKVLLSCPDKEGLLLALMTISVDSKTQNQSSRYKNAILLPDFLGQFLCPFFLVEDLSRTEKSVEASPIVRSSVLRDLGLSTNQFLIFSQTDLDRLGGPELTLRELG